MMRKKINIEFMWLVYFSVSAVILISNIRYMTSDDHDFEILGSFFRLVMPLILVVYSFRYVVRLENKVGLAVVGDDVSSTVLFWIAIYVYVILGIFLYWIYYSEFTELYWYVCSFFAVLYLYLSEKYIIFRLRGKKLIESQNK